MKIRINNTDPSGCYGSEVINIRTGKIIHCGSGILSRYWDENDIFNLLGEKKFAQYENGAFEFEVTKDDIFCASDDMDYYSDNSRKYKKPSLNLKNNS